MQLEVIWAGNRTATCLLWSRDVHSSTITMAYPSFKETFDFTLKQLKQCKVGKIQR